MYGIGNNQLQRPRGSYCCGPPVTEMWVKRDKIGFGFSILGHNPCYVNFVRTDSPAGKAGLRSFDTLLSINGNDVRRMEHDEIVEILGKSGNFLKLEVVKDNVDPAWKNFLGLAKSGFNYPETRNTKTYAYEQISAARGAPFESLHFHPKEKNPKLHTDRHLFEQRNNVMKSHSSRKLDYYSNDLDRENGPVVVDQYERYSSKELKTINEAPSKQERKQKYQYTKNKPSKMRIKESSENLAPTIEEREESVVKKIDLNGLPKVLIAKENQKLKDNKRTKIIHEEEAMEVHNNVIQKDVDDFQIVESFPADDGNARRFVVYYLSSSGVPYNKLRAKSHFDAASLAAKRVNLAKVGDPVLLSFDPVRGIRLVNREQKLISEFKLDYIACCHTPSLSEDAKGLFVIVIMSIDESGRIQPERDVCHVFRIDPTLTSHSKHVALANRFAVECTVNSDDRCLEFPSTVEEVADFINASLKKLKHADNIDRNFESKTSSDGHFSTPSTSNQLQNRREFLKQEKLKFLNSSDAENHQVLFKSFTPVSRNQKTSSTSNPPRFTEKQISNSNIRAPTNLLLLKDECDGDLYDIPHRLTSTPCKSVTDNHLVKLEADVPDVSLMMSPNKSIHNSSSLLQNRSICMSLESVLDDLAKSARKLKVTCEPADLQDGSKKLSFSSGAINRSKTGSTQEGLLRSQQWFLNFDLLLRDEAGAATFMQFLKKEFSQENLIFWLKCRHFKNLFFTGSPIDAEKIRVMSREIYEDHVAESAPYQVNIDGTVRKAIEAKLEGEKPENLLDVFEAAQKHIYELMKSDTYARFKASEIYLRALNNEKTGKPFEFCELNFFSGSSKSLISKKSSVYNSKPDLKKSKSKTDNSEWGAKNEKRRSLLTFWKKKKSISGSLENNAMMQSNENLPPLPSSSTLLPEKKADKNPKHCKVIIPVSGVAAKIPIEEESTVGETLLKLGSTIDPGPPFTGPVDEGSGQLISLSESAVSLLDKVISIEKYGISRLSLPGVTKSLIIRYKLNSSLLEVLEPVLKSRNLYNQSLVIKINNVLLAKSDWSFAIDVFNCKHINIEISEGLFENSQEKICQLLKDLTMTRLESSVVFLKDLFQDCFLGAPKHVSSINVFSSLPFDEYGIASIDDIKTSMKLKRKRNNVPKLFNFMRRSSVDKSKALKSRNSMYEGNAQQSLENSARHSLDVTKFPAVRPQKEEERVFIDLLSKAQSRTLDDQRGKCSWRDLKLPDFLKEEDDDTSQPSDIGQPDEIEICPDFRPNSNQFSLRRRRENSEENLNQEDFNLVGNDWDDLLNDEDKLSLLGGGGLIPSVEEADLFFCGGMSPPPLTVIERGDRLM